MEETPACSNGSTCIVEKEVQEVAGIVNSIYLGLHEKRGMKMDTRGRIVALIPGYAAYL